VVGVVLRTGLGGAGIRGEKHRHRVPAAQEVVRHHERAVGALHLVERGWQVLGVRQAGKEQGEAAEQQQWNGGTPCAPCGIVCAKPSAAPVQPHGRPLCPSGQI
jgi:hypothetical protein